LLLAVAGRTLELEHPALRRQAARRREAVERAIRGDHSVARDDDRERVTGEGPANISRAERIVSADGPGDWP
jgi:hypothetical protein